VASVTNIRLRSMLGPGVTPSRFFSSLRLATSYTPIPIFVSIRHPGLYPNSLFQVHQSEDLINPLLPVSLIMDPPANSRWLFLNWQRLACDLPAPCKFPAAGDCPRPPLGLFSSIALPLFPPGKYCLRYFEMSALPYFLSFQR